MPPEAIVGAFDDEELAERTVRWLRRSGLHARIQHVGRAYEVVVPAGREEAKAHRVLRAVELAHKRSELAEPSKWDKVRSRLLNLESVGIVVAIVVLAVLALAIGIWLWALAGMLGWLALIVVMLAALAYFHFSGIPHSAVKAPRPYSHKHDITMEEEQQVQYRLAWAREQYRKSQEWSARWRRKKD